MPRKTWAPVLGTWHHIAYTFNSGTHVQALYLDGVTVMAGSASGTIGYDTQPLLIGADISSGAYSYFHGGLLDEVSLYSRALSASEIHSLYIAGSAGKCPVGVAPLITTQPASQTVAAGSSATFTTSATGTAPLSYQWQFSGTNIAGATGTSLTLSNVQPAQAGNYAVLVTNAFGSITSSNALLTVCAPTNGLTAYYPFNGNANDASGNGNNGLVNGATLTADRFGSPNSAYRFNGTSWIQLPDTVEPLQPSGLTVSAWVLADSGANAAGAWLIHLTSRTGEGGMGIWNAGSWGVWVKLQNSYSPGYYANQDTAIPSVWTHIVAVYSQGQSVEFWVNGSLIQSNTLPNYPLYTNPSFPLNSSIGNYDYSPGPYNGFTGAMDDVRIYNCALSPGEVQAIYQCEATPPDYPIITQQPQSQTVLAGSNVTFMATSTGTAPLSYQWWFGGSSISGATSTSLTLSNVQPAQAGSYTVWVTNAYGSAISSNAVLTVNPASGCVTPPAGLVGWWRGEGNGNDSAGTNNAYALPNVSFTNGVVGQAFAFDPENLPFGTYSGVRIADQPAYALTNSLSIEAWIRPRGDGYVIFYRGDNRSGLDPYTMSMGLNNILSFAITDANGNSAGVSAPLVYNQWWHVAGTLDGASGNLSLYTNGSLAAQITTTVRPFGALIPGDSPGIGIGNVNDGFNNFPFLGDIDEVSLYSRALSGAEIAAIYNAGSAGKCPPAPPANCTPAPAGLVGWWAGEGNALDSAGGNNGTLQGDTTFAPGIVGQAFNFDPASGTVIVPDSPSLRLTNQLTIEGWINTWANTDPGGYAIVSKLSYPTGNNGYQFLVVGNTLQGLFNSPGTSWPSQRIISGPVINTGVWYHVAFTYDQSAMKLYCNGQPVATNVIGAQAIATSSSDLHISGVDSSHTYFDGLIDEISVYNRALSDAEIAGIYGAGSAGKCGLPPSIMTQPQSQVAAVGSNITFTVTAGGSPPLGYQWRLGGANVVGATDSALVLTNVQLAQAGTYAVLVTNPVGSVLSSNAVLTVNPPAGVSFLMDLDFGMGQTQSSKVGFAAIGQTTNDFWNYYTRDDGNGGYRTFGALSNLALVDGTVTAVGMTISNAPGGWYNGSTDPMYDIYLYPFDGGNVTVTLTNLPTGFYKVLPYSFNGILEVTVGGVSYGIQQTSDNPVSNPPVWTAGKQYALYTNVPVSLGQALVVTVMPVGGYATISGMQISWATVVTGTPPVIATQPQSQTVWAGSNVTFTVTANGTAPLSYQWLLGGQIWSEPRAPRWRWRMSKPLTQAGTRCWWPTRLAPSSVPTPPSPWLKPLRDRLWT